MPNKVYIKTGLEASRSGVTPETGELLWTTDDHELFVGDGSTAGGISLSYSPTSHTHTDYLLNTTDSLTGNLDVTGKMAIGTSIHGTYALAINGTIEAGQTGGGLRLGNSGNNGMIQSINTSSSYVPLYIQAGSSFLTSVDGDNAIGATAGGSVDLYYDGVKVATTTADGIDTDQIDYTTTLTLSDGTANLKIEGRTITGELEAGGSEAPFIGQSLTQGFTYGAFGNSLHIAYDEDADTESGAGYIAESMTHKAISGDFKWTVDANVEVGRLTQDGYLDNGFKRPVAHLRQVANQNLGGVNGTNNQVKWDKTPDRIDTDYYTHSTSTNPSRCTVVEAGRYQITGHIGLNPSGSGRTTLVMRVRIDGSNTHAGAARGYHRGSNYGDFSVHLDTERELTAGQYIEMDVEVDDSDGTYTTDTWKDECELIIRKVE